MSVQTIQKEILIRVPKEVVWQVLLNDEFTRQWYEAFGEGSHAETDWKEGSKAIFADQTGNGLVATIKENKLHEMIKLEFVGAMTNGVKDPESAMAKSMNGGLEIYRLAEVNGGTQLSISSDVDVRYSDAVAAAWEKALEHLKALAENSCKEFATAP